MKANPAAPTCFISYSWDSEAHKEWVYRLAEDLRAEGIDAILDQYEVAPGNDFIAFMERSVKRSKFVVLVCTPRFFEKSSSRRDGAGYEGAIIANELLRSKSPATQRKFVPIVREGVPSRVLPAYLAHRAHIDFRDDGTYEVDLAKLVLHLHGKPQRPVPPLGGANRSDPAPSPARVPASGSRLRAKPTPQVRSPPRNVFISVSSPSGSVTFLHAAAFALLALDFVPRTALETSSAQTRVHRVLEAIRQSEWTVHNLQVAAPQSEVSFNAAFELGAAVAYASSLQASGRAVLIMSPTPQLYQAGLSDVSGFDVVYHNDDPERIIVQLCAFAAIRGHETTAATRPASLVQMYRAFGEDLRGTAKSLGMTLRELESPEYLLDYVHLAKAWLQQHDRYRAE